MNLQLPFDELSNPKCICKELLDPWDISCYAMGGGRSKYQFHDESSPAVTQALADCEGLGFGTIQAKPLAGSHNLPGFVPVVTHGSRKLFDSFNPPYVGVMIGEVVTPNLTVHPDIRQHLGVPDSTKIILLGYGKDELIENIWPVHRHVLKQLRQAGVDLVVPINYSVWHSQPHIERLINVKRGLVVYQTLQDLGFEALPHMYWSGPADLRRWAAWLNTNSTVLMVAIDLQTIKTGKDMLWNRSINELAAFAPLLNRPMRYLISGPQTPGRVAAVMKALGPNVVFTNGTAAISAWNHRAVDSSRLNGSPDQSALFAANCRTYSDLIRRCRLDQLQRADETQNRQHVTSEIESHLAQFRAWQRQQRNAAVHHRKF